MKDSLIKAAIISTPVYSPVAMAFKTSVKVEKKS